MNAAALTVSAFALTGLYASWSDATRRILPNTLCLIVALLGMAASWQAGGFTALGSGLLHGFIALLVGMALFAVKAIGGGDAKYYAAVAVWFPIKQGLWLLTWVSCAGLLLILGWFVVRRLQKRKALAASGSDHGKFPYGVAVAIGGAIALATAV